MLRQNNTNNYIESQFLVIKDQILNRVKECNVVGLLGKLVNELENHYTTKLLSVADGSFDGIYSYRFKGQVSLPSAAKLTDLCEGVVSVGVEVFHVASFREPDTKYLVDMNLGVCQCAQGSTGAPCKHQFLLWSRGFSSSSENYIPVYSAALKKQYADLAVNGSAPIEFYEGNRERILPSCHVERHGNNDVNNCLTNEHVDEPSSSSILASDADVDDHAPIPSSPQNLEEADKVLESSFTYLRFTLLLRDPSLLSGYIKWSRNLQNIPISLLGSLFHCFDRNDTYSIKTKKHPKKQKIPIIDPSRRKIQSGSKQKVSKGNRRIGGMAIPSKTMVTGKRKHSLLTHVFENKPMPKKNSRTMISRRKVVSSNKSMRKLDEE